MVTIQTDKIMGKYNTYGIVDLTDKEMREINGGWMALVGLLIAGFMAGYEIGKSAAERDRRLQSADK